MDDMHVARIGEPLARALRSDAAVVVFTGPATPEHHAALAAALAARPGRVIHLAAPFKGPLGLQSRLAAELGLDDSRASGPADLVAALPGPPEPVLLAIEDAHAMGTRGLQYLDLLQRFATSAGVPITLLLAGRPSLLEALDMPSLADLRDRATARVELGQPGPPEPEPPPAVG